MKFFLGTHRPHWLWNLDIPLFVSRRTLQRYKTLHTATAPWALDSGGFTELSIHGKWTIDAATYASELSRFQEIGNLQWAAPQDWMCEPWIIKKTGLNVEIHQQKTVDNYLQLKQLNAPVIPVLQGWDIDDYEKCAILYQDYGVDLTKQNVVGLGSVCRRQATDEIGQIVQWAKKNNINVHGFRSKICRTA